MSDVLVRLRDGSVEMLDQDWYAFKYIRRDDEFLESLALRTQNWVFATKTGALIPKDMVVLVWEEP